MKQTDYSSDAHCAIAAVETAHPAFLMDEIPENYEGAKAEYLQSVASPMIPTDFLLATQKYLAVLGDRRLPRVGRYISVQWISVDDRLYLVDGESQVTDYEVIRIGGVPVEDVRKQVDTYYSSENDSAKQRQYEVYCRQDDMLLLARSQFEDTIEIVTRDSCGAENTQNCGFVSSDIYSIYYGGFPAYVVEHRMLGDVFYVDLRTFRQGNEVTNTAKAIKEAIGKGTTKFIIDIRGNTGGNSNVGGELLAAMEMTPPSYGCYVYHSDLSKKLRGGSASGKIIYYKPDPSTAQKNKDIELVVLTDRLTFSSATMLGVWAQDGDLGVIVGQPSSNAPTCYGDMLSVHLPVSNINLNVSYKEFLRPDVNADQDTLQPDILTGFDEDVLEVALEYLADK